MTSTSAPSAFTSYSRFTLANKVGGKNPLPIELLFFTAKPVDKTVRLDWATASELNNSHFDIERSQDGVNFEHLVKINALGNGTSITTQNYNTLDENPYKGLSYYRLKQTDKNGDYKYANIQSVEFNSESYINLYPNPTSSILHIKTSANYENATLKIINAIGIEVKLSTKINLYNGTIDVSDLASGIYYALIENGTSIENIKINIQK